MYGCESWTIKKPEHQRIDAFELWWWRRLLRVHWTARRSNQSTLKEINPDYSSEGDAEAPILWPPDVENWLIRKDPDAGKEWRQEEKGMTEDEMVVWHHWLNGHEFEQAPGHGSMGMNLSKLQEMVNNWEAWFPTMGMETAGHDWVTEQQGQF